MTRFIEVFHCGGKPLFYVKYVVLIQRNKATYQSFPLSFQDYPSQRSKIDQHRFADLLD